MALSGSSYKAFARHRLVIEWSAGQKIPENQSTVTARVYLQSMDGYGAMYAPVVNKGSVTVNGQTQNFTASSDLKAYQKKLLATKSFTVPHNADGSKRFSFSATFYINVTFAGVFYGNQTASGSAYLNQIPRASSISLSPSTANFGDTIRININRASNAFTHTITFKWGSRADETIINKTTSTSVNYTTSSSLTQWIPNSTSGWGTIVCDTYNGNTKIGTSSARLTLNIGNVSAYAPIINSVTISEYDTSITSKFGYIYLQGKSRLKVDISATFQGGATLKSAETRIGSSLTVNGLSGVSGTLNETGNITVSTTVTDSRGASKSQSLVINVIPYRNPSLVTFNLARRASQQEVVDFSWTATTSPVNGKNNMGFRITYRKLGTTTWYAITSGANSYQSTWTGSTSKAGFDVGSSYEVKFEVFDSMMTSSTFYNLATATVPMSWGKTGTAIGKVYEEGKETFQVRGSGFYEGNLKLANSLYKDVGGAINANNSDMVGLNGIYFGAGGEYGGYDPTDTWGEGLLFPKSTTWLRPDNAIKNPGATEWDNLRILDGVGYLNGVPVFVDFGNLGQPLWSGMLHVYADQVAYISKALDECPHGWVLRWEAYADGKAQGHNFNYSLVHKAQQGRGGGFNQLIIIGDTPIQKYCYASVRGQLKGHNDNYNNATARRLVLTEVYAW